MKNPPDFTPEEMRHAESYDATSEYAEFIEAIRRHERLNAAAAGNNLYGAEGPAVVEGWRIHDIHNWIASLRAVAREWNPHPQRDARDIAMDMTALADWLERLYPEAVRRR